MSLPPNMPIPESSPSILLIILPIVVIIGVVLLLWFWIKMIIHAASKPIEHKTAWILVLVFLGWLGGIIYYFSVKRKFTEATPMIPDNDMTPPVAPTQ